jgi:CheY-like chemotaxis protein
MGAYVVTQPGSKMTFNVLIVEDQALIAMEIEDSVQSLGYHVAGVAASKADVARVSGVPDIALVDVNLLDGPTGPEIGKNLALNGSTVVFMTANPELVSNGIEGAVGVMTKPVKDLDLVTVIQFAAALRAGRSATPPLALLLFA